MPRKSVIHETDSKSAAEYKLPKKPDAPTANAAIGVTGFQVNFGSDNLIGADEYNVTLQGNEGIKKFNQMSRNDPTVAATLLLLEMPIITADWVINPPDDATPDEIEATEWVRWAIFEAPDQDFHTILRIALASLKFGFSLVEKIYDYDEKGWLYVRRFAPRLQSTISEWLFDKNEKLTGFVQKVYSGEFQGEYTIPEWKTILFTNRSEADSPRGQSILRPAYKPWVQKEKFEKYQAMQAMRHAVGIPKLTAPPKFTAQDKNDAIDLAKNLRSHQQAYAFLPNGWELDFMDNGANKTLDLLPMIKYRDERIAVSVLAGFLNLGMSETGAKSLGESLSSIFLKNLQGTANYIADQINNKLIYTDLMPANFPKIDRKRYPRMSVGGIVTDALLEYAQALNQAFSAQAITPDAETEDFVRQKFRMPKKVRTEEPPADPEEQQDPTDVESTDEPTKAKETHSHSVKKLASVPDEYLNFPVLQSRPVRQNERYVTWKAIEGSLDSAITQIVTTTQDIKDQVLVGLRQQIMDALKSGQPSDAMKINVPDADELRTADAVEEILQGLYDYGRQTIQEEKARQQKAQKKAAELKKPPKIKPVNPAAGVTDPKNVEAVLQALSVRLGQRVWQQVENTARDMTIAAIARGSADIDAIMEALTDLSSRAVENSARSVVPEAFGKGRAYEIEQLADEIDYMQLSAALDKNTCEPCARLDREGAQYIVGSPEFYQYMPPLTQLCDGGSRCRCIYIANFTTSAPEA